MWNGSWVCLCCPWPRTDELLDAMCGIQSGPPEVSKPVPEDEYYRYNPGTR